MRTVFADTGYWAALLNPRDQLHPRATEVSKDLQQVRYVTTEMILAELLNLLSGKGAHLRAVACTLVGTLRDDPNTDIVPQTSTQFQEALAFYRKREDKQYSLTDCASFEVMKDRGLREALTYDQHFVQAGYEALLRE
jgi:predicted nucleic acid-binding protein